MTHQCNYRNYRINILVAKKTCSLSQSIFINNNKNVYKNNVDQVLSVADKKLLQLMKEEYPFWYDFFINNNNNLQILRSLVMKTFESVVNFLKTILSTLICLYFNYSVLESVINKCFKYAVGVPLLSFQMMIINALFFFNFV